MPRKNRRSSAICKPSEAPGDPNEIAAFSIGQAGWFLLFFALAIGIVILIMAGIFSGRRARLGGILLGAVLLVDLGRANLPWITHWDYQQKYASDPIVDILRDKPYEHRVIQLPFRVPDQFALFNGNAGLYGIEWVQQLFPYYNIQSLDLVMRPRVGSDLELYEANFLPASEDKSYLLPRHWQLTNTRYLLGPAGFLDVLNQQLDPAQHRFRIVQRFAIAPKPGVEQVTKLEELTAVPDDNGPYALFEFTGALPRAKLYSNWQLPMNDKTAVGGSDQNQFGRGWMGVAATGRHKRFSHTERTGLARVRPVANRAARRDAGGAESSGHGHQWKCRHRRVHQLRAHGHQVSHPGRHADRAAAQRPV